jgi:HD-GYP domain-containing protein (c-di-GMP phosphodiesterase class II)/DNA-binding LacI/PurR family transcriptional regulator
MDTGKNYKRIGVFVDWRVDHYQQTLLRGIADYAEKEKISCLFFEGGGLNSPLEYEAERNSIYRLAGAETVDGLIFFSASLAHFISRSEMTAFCAQYRPLPLVSISMEMENMPSVLVDNQSGMRELMLHLIEGHGFRRFAFITGAKGNLDTQNRYNAFTKALEEQAIPLDPRLVIEGDFTRETGIAAARYIFDNFRTTIDVIVASNDIMAMGAIEELTRRGIRVPEDIAVTGFDDIEACAYTRPTLTTVKLPFYEQGWMAAKIISDCLDGIAHPRNTLIPTSLAIRESCKCFSNQPAAGMESQAENRNPSSHMLNKNDLLFSRVLRISENLAKTGAHGRLAQSTAGIRPEETGSPPSINGTSLPGGLAADIDFPSFQNMLSRLWFDRHSIGRDKELAEKTADISFRLVMDMGRNIVQHQFTRTNEVLLEHRVFYLSYQLHVDFDISKQMDVLALRLPALGIKSFFLSLFDTDPESVDAKSVCLLSVRDGKRTAIGPEGLKYPLHQIVPDDFLSNAHQHFVVIEALKQYGFIVFEIEPSQERSFIFLSDIISGALQAALLYREIGNQKNSLIQNLEQMRKAMAGFIQTMSLTIEMHDPYTAGHQRRVSDLARTIAQQMKLTPKQIETVRMAAIIHDLGKLYIPAEILNRAGPLNEIEYRMVKNHPKAAYDVIKNIEFPWPIARIVYQHHERFNGSGYPNGLTRDQISIEAQILAVADVVEAMASHRPYRVAHDIRMALEEITKNRGILYDPDVVDACLILFQQKGYKLKE